jgi:hypothetical protein
MSSDQPAIDMDIIGRADVNDLEAILAISNEDVDEAVHAVQDNADAIFTWDYSLARPQLRKLYEKAKTGQWNATTDLDWDTEVDLEKVVTADQVSIFAGLGAMASNIDRTARCFSSPWGSAEVIGRTLGVVTGDGTARGEAFSAR